jgi:S-DNA-T family DNA segregation ATPase FtsK/SpoIIIE
MRKSSGRQRKAKKKRDKGRLREIFGLFLIALGILTLLSLIGYQGEPESGVVSQNILGSFGANLSYFLIQFFFGRWPAYVFPLAFFIWSGAIFFSWHKLKTLIAIAGFLFLAFWIAFTVSLIEAPNPVSEHAGLIGISFGSLIQGFMGIVGAWIVWFFVVVVGLVVLLRIKPSQILQKILLWTKAVIVWFWEHRPRRFPKFRMRGKKPESIPDFTSEHIESKPDESPPEPVSEDIFIAGMETPVQGESQIVDKPSSKKGQYRLPPLDILADPPPESPDAPEELKAKAKRLQEALADFGVGARVVKVNPGPVITRFDLEPDPGVKVNRISNLADDLALVLRAKAIRIQAPIPGQGAVGVEIPNRQPSVVVLKAIASTPAFTEESSPLIITMGSKASGKPYVSDLAKMPHLLVAGTTGSGKSVCLNAIIVSLLLRNPPEKLQFVIIDPKKLELSVYARLARHHLLTSDELQI